MLSKWLSIVLMSSVIGYASAAPAAENWVLVTTNSVGDRFLIDQNSIERNENSVRYWQYRDFQQPNNAILDFQVDRPVYGVMFYQSSDCQSGTERLWRVVAFDQNRQVIRRVNYEENGALSQPNEGSSAAAVLKFACDRQ
ncbi:MAG TPA: surface-adhesin E family protein [Trichocoleus sp.]